jgi:hypothetical protein
MSQYTVHNCPTCNTRLAPEQHFCPRCGTVIDSGAHQRTERSSAGSTDGFLPPTPPPPPPALLAQQQPYYAAPPKDSTKSVLRQISCGLLSMILLVVVLCSTVSYFGYNWLKGLGDTTGGTTSSTNGSAAPDNTPSPIKTTSLTGTQPLSVIYSDVKITLIDAKQAGSFTDDSTASRPGVVRISFKEEQANGKAANYAYSDVMRLVLPGGAVVSPLTAKNGISPDVSTTRQNWIDFPASTNLNISDMLLRVGTDAEALMEIPLKPNANVTRYQPKTVTLNKQTQYTGLTWTLTSAIARWSADGKQADKGMMYVVVSLKIDNTSSRDSDADPDDYIRLKTGDVTASPSGTTIPLSIVQGQTGATGNATFQVPQGSTDFSLIFLAVSSIAGSQQATIPFQI